jgi:electron transfer flavoprotein alpha subunit
MSGVLVVTEQQNGRITGFSLEAIAFGQQLAALRGMEVSAAVLGRSDQAVTLATESSKYRLSKSWAIAHELLGEYTSDGYVIALEQFISQDSPDFVVFPHSYQVRDFAPAIATRFRQVLISDVISIHDGTSPTGPLFVRQLLQGKTNADYRHAGNGPCFVSIQAGSYRASDIISGEARIDAFHFQLAKSQIRNRPGERFRESANTVDLSVAPVIVSVGRGIGEQDNIPIIEELAAALGAEMAASRPICDNGWLPMERQVGSSGQTVSPKLYLAVGISGAIQHLVGMKGSKAVIAINKDENAPIFEVADYGVVGDLFEIVPALTKAVLAAKS